MTPSPWRAELDLEAANNVFFLHLLVKTLSSLKILFVNQIISVKIK